MSGQPARRYSWPPFQPGNKATMTHGAWSRDLVEGRAGELVPAILEANPQLNVERDGAAVFRYAVTRARIERVYRWLGEQGDPVFEDAKAGVAHGVFERLERWERQADAAEERLAIAPLTRARLGLDLIRGRSLEDEIAESRGAWERHEVIDAESQRDRS